jgi:hypothetical protein
MEKCAVFSCMGLGDGLIALVLSNNLQLNGYSVDTFHPFLHELQDWFPHLPLMPFPQFGIEILEQYDRYFIIYEKSPWMRLILAYCLESYPNKTVVLNPIATRRKDYPYWEGGQFDGSRPFVDNLFRFCSERLRLKVTTKSNGISPPAAIVPRKWMRRVVLHPESSREGKNWPKEKYLQLTQRLKGAQFQPVFALTQKEREKWKLDDVDAPSCATLSDLAQLVCESGYFIGNDSGVGHLASCLGLTTLTICRNAQAAKFWRPAWSRGSVVTPSFLVPNLKGMRWRDRHWKSWVGLRRVWREFQQLTTQV